MPSVQDLHNEVENLASTSTNQKKALKRFVYSVLSHTLIFMYLLAQIQYLQSFSLSVRLGVEFNSWLALPELYFVFVCSENQNQNKRKVKTKEVGAPWKGEAGGNVVLFYAVC